MDFWNSNLRGRCTAVLFALISKILKSHTTLRYVLHPKINLICFRKKKKRKILEFQISSQNRKTLKNEQDSRPHTNFNTQKLRNS